MLDPGATCKRALVRDGNHVYDTKIGPQGLQLESTRARVLRDADNPKRFDVTVGDDPGGHKILAKRFPAKKFRELSRKRVLLADRNVTFDFGFGTDLKLTALKMAAALASLVFPELVSGFTAPHRDLAQGVSGVRPTCVQLDLRDHVALDALRGPSAT